MVVDIDEKSLKHGVSELVITLVEIVRDALKFQAMKRIESGSLTEEEVEKLGETFMELDTAIEVIKEEQGIIEELPWQKYIEASDEELDKFVVSGFGTSFPTDPIKGDSFVRVDSLPSKLYRWNGTNWIEIDKNNSDTFANNPEYVQYLIDKLGSGEYDPDLLTDAERLQIESQLKSQDL